MGRGGARRTTERREREGLGGEERDPTTVLTSMVGEV